MFVEFLIIKNIVRVLILKNVNLGRKKPSVNKMGKKYDSCVKQVKAKIKKAEIGKNYKCDAQGKPNPRGRHRCKSSPHKICAKLR